MLFIQVNILQKEFVKNKKCIKRIKIQIIRKNKIENKGGKNMLRNKDNRRINEKTNPICPIFTGNS